MSAGLAAHLSPPARFREKWNHERHELTKTNRTRQVEALQVGTPGLRLDGTLKSVQATAGRVGKSLDRSFKCATHPITRQIIVWRLR